MMSISSRRGVACLPAIDAKERQTNEWIAENVDKNIWTKLEDIDEYGSVFALPLVVRVLVQRGHDRDITITAATMSTYKSRERALCVCVRGESGNVAATIATAI